MPPPTPISNVVKPRLMVLFQLMAPSGMLNIFGCGLAVVVVVGVVVVVDVDIGLGFGGGLLGFLCAL